jgi:hypothetical protein
MIRRTEQDRLRMDINEISTIVQQQFLRRRIYSPTIFVELDGAGIQVLGLPHLDEKKRSTPKRARMLFDAGRTFGQRTQWTRPTVTGLCMASLTVAQDIFKQGMLVVKMDEDNRLNCEARFYEVRKDGSESGVYLLENPFLSGEGMVSLLLPAFMLGVEAVHGQLSTNEARRMLSALLHEYEQMISGIGCYERYPGITVHA